MSRRIPISLLVGGIAAMVQYTAVAANLTLAWDAPTTYATEIAGYVIYYGTDSRNYATQVPVGNTTNCTITSFVEGTTYYLAATTLGTSGFESDYSDEFVYPPEVNIVWPTNAVGRTNFTGETVSFGVTAKGMPPLSYRWYRSANALSNALNVSGATSPTLALSLVTSNDAGSYKVVVTNAWGSATSGPITLTVKTPIETKPPSVTVLPNSGFEFETNNVIKVFGTAVDSAPGAVMQVLVGVNGGGWQLASITNLVPERAVWTNPVNLVAGTNTVHVKAVDSSVNESKVASRTFFLRVPSPLALVTNGSGSISVLTPPPYYVGRSYSLQVTPGEGYLFSNLVAQAGGGSSILYTATPDMTAQKGAKIRFAMQTNLTLIANFVPNRFIGAAGTYYGLFRDPSAVAHQSGGFIKFKTDSKLKFTGSVYLEGEKAGFAGTFNLAGVGALKNPVIRKGMMNEPISIVPVIDLDGGRLISGSVSNAMWSANLLADLAVYGPTSATPPSVVGQYTMILPGSANFAAEAGGDGYSVITVQADGMIKTAGHFGDGEAAKALKAPISKDGWWPFYSPLYKTYRPATNPPTYTGTAVTYNGSVMGWLRFTGGNLQHELFWNKTRWTNGIYNDGFTNWMTVQASRYAPPAALGQHVLPITNGSVMLLNGNLASPITNGFLWSDLNRIVFGRYDNPNAIRLSVNARDGSLSGSFVVNTNTPTVITKIYGAVLQNTNVARGNFKGASQSGSIRLQGN